MYLSFTRGILGVKRRNCGNDTKKKEEVPQGGGWSTKIYDYRFVALCYEDLECMGQFKSK